MDSFVAENGLSFGTYAILLIGTLVKMLIAKKKKEQLVALVIPPGSDRQKMIDKFQNEAPDVITKNFYLWHIEKNIKESTEFKAIESEMKILQGRDPIGYNTKWMTLLEKEMDNSLNKIKITGRIIVLILSSPEYAKYLKIKKVYSYNQSNKLVKTVNEHRDDALWLDYLRTLTNPKNSETFGDTDDLFDLVQSKLLDIAKKNKKN